MPICKLTHVRMLHPGPAGLGATGCSSKMQGFLPLDTAAQILSGDDGLSSSCLET